MASPNFGDRRGKTIDSLILHYTGMRSGADALARLCDPDAGVSCHYLVWEDGRVDQLVAEAERAWHAGHAFWAGERDVNAVSIGIEIVNGGHDHGCPPYPDRQVDAVIALARDVCTRNAIGPDRVLAHSDVAPDRKKDPGEWFPWARLAAQGVGLWVDAPSAAEPVAEALSPGDRNAAVRQLQERLATFGYHSPATGVYDQRTRLAVAAFQRHFRPARIDGAADAVTCATLAVLLKRRAQRRSGSS